MQVQTVLPEMSDEWLLVSYRRDRVAAHFAELVRRYERELYGYLRRYLGNAELAEDAFQAVFLQVHLKCDQYEEGRPLRPWIYMIATNKAIDLKRRHGRLRVVSMHGTSTSSDDYRTQLADQLAGNGPAPDAPLDRLEQNERLLRIVEELPEHLRAVVHLVYFQGLKYRDAAEVLSIPVGTVKSRMNAAIGKLTEAWGTDAANPE